MNIVLGPAAESLAWPGGWLQGWLRVSLIFVLPDSPTGPGCQPAPAPLCLSCAVGLCMHVWVSALLFQLDPCTLRGSGSQEGGVTSEEEFKSCAGSSSFTMAQTPSARPMSSLGILPADRQEWGRWLYPNKEMT